MNQMSNMSGDEWKDVRSTFSPIFTSGKLKSMLRFVTGVAENLVQEFAAKAKLGTDFELKEVYGKFRQGNFCCTDFEIVYNKLMQLKPYKKSSSTGITIFTTMLVFNTKNYVQNSNLSL
jgi:Cytochrome P450